MYSVVYVIAPSQQRMMILSIGPGVMVVRGDFLGRDRRKVVPEFFLVKKKRWLAGTVVVSTGGVAVNGNLYYLAACLHKLYMYFFRFLSENWCDHICDIS